MGFNTQECRDLLNAVVLMLHNHYAIHQNGDYSEKFFREHDRMIKLCEKLQSHIDATNNNNTYLESK